MPRRPHDPVATATASGGSCVRAGLAVRCSRQRLPSFACSLIVRQGPPGVKVPWVDSACVRACHPRARPAWVAWLGLDRGAERSDDPLNQGGADAVPSRAMGGEADGTCLDRVGASRASGARGSSGRRLIAAMAESPVAPRHRGTRALPSPSRSYSAGSTRGRHVDAADRRSRVSRRRARGLRGPSAAEDRHGVVSERPTGGEVAQSRGRCRGDLGFGALRGVADPTPGLRWPLHSPPACGNVT